MKKILFVCQVEFGNQADGVVKKTKGQIQAFKDIGLDVICIAYYNGVVSYSNCEEVGNLSFTALNNYSGKAVRLVFWNCVRKFIYSTKDVYDFAYIRYSFIDQSVLYSIRLMKRWNIYVMMEIPSIKRNISFRSGIVAIQYVIDKLLNHKCKKLIDKLIYVGDKKIQIWGMEAHPIPNGIPFGFDNIKRTGINIIDSKIVMIAVSTMGVSRGYDRLIMGLKDYYDKGGKCDFLLKFVGAGEIIPNLKELAERFDLKEHVQFISPIGGKELDEVFETSTIGVGALGLYNVNSNFASTLKIKEYLVRGLPFIYAGDEIGIPCPYDYALVFPNDPTIIDFNRIVRFVERLELEPKEDIIEKMNSFAYKTFSWKSIIEELMIDCLDKD